MDLYQIAIASARNCLWIEAVSIFSRSTLINVLCVCVCFVVCLCVCCCSCLLLAACCCTAVGSTYVVAIYFFSIWRCICCHGLGDNQGWAFLSLLLLFVFLCIALLFSLIVFCLFLLCSVLLRFVCFIFDVVYVIFFNVWLNTCIHTLQYRYACITCITTCMACMHIASPIPNGDSTFYWVVRQCITCMVCIYIAFHVFDLLFLFCVCLIVMIYYDVFSSSSGISESCICISSCRWIGKR